MNHFYRASDTPVYLSFLLYLPEIDGKSEFFIRLRPKMAEIVILEV